jgi:hypothetical protein
MSATLEQKPRHRDQVMSWTGVLAASKLISKLKTRFRSKKLEEAKNSLSQVDSSGSDSDRDGENVVHSTNRGFVPEQQSPVPTPVNRTNRRLRNDGSLRRSIYEATQSNVSLAQRHNELHPPLVNEATKSNTSLDQRRNVRSNAESDYEDAIGCRNGEHRTTGRRQTTAPANNRQQPRSGREFMNERERSDRDVNAGYLAHNLGYNDGNSARSISNVYLDRNNSTSTRGSRREFSTSEQNSTSGFANRRNGTRIDNIEQQCRSECHEDHPNVSPTQRNSFNSSSNPELDDDGQSYSGRSRATEHHPTRSPRDYELRQQLGVEAMEQHSARSIRNQPTGEIGDHGPQQQTRFEAPEQSIPSTQQRNGLFVDLDDKTRTPTPSLRNGRQQHQSSLEPDHSQRNITFEVKFEINDINNADSQEFVNKSAETLVKKWRLTTIDSQIEKIEEQRARLERERQEQEDLEESRAETRNVVYRWKMSVRDDKMKAAASAEKCFREWKKKADKSKTAREIEELDLQKESVKQRRNSVVAGNAWNTWKRKTPAIKKRDQWRVQEKGRRVLVEQSFVDKQSNQDSLSYSRAQEIKRISLEKSVTPPFPTYQKPSMTDLFSLAISSEFESKGGSSWV